MNGTDIAIAGVLILIVGGALAYIIKKKKSGAKCIGCPDGESCCGGCCNCKK